MALRTKSRGLFNNWKTVLEQAAWAKLRSARKDPRPLLGGCTPRDFELYQESAQGGGAEPGAAGWLRYNKCACTGKARHKQGGVVRADHPTGRGAGRHTIRGV